MSLTELEGSASAPGPPRWLAPSLDVREGRDPLGLQTTTQDRLTPVLLPGILELSRRARYFSFHAWLLHTYRERKFTAENNALSTFIKAREWDYGLAVLSCPHGCGSSPVGAQSLRGVVSQPGPFPRGESVKSPFGGYGLYYRSPMAEIGLIARAGTLLGDAPIPIDVLYDSERARRLVETFSEAVANTAYAQHWMLTSEPLPVDVLVEFADVACLCQLRARPAERNAVHDALFTIDEHSADSATTAPNGGATNATEDLAPIALGAEAALTQRRQSVAHYLTLVEADPAVVDDGSAYREALWSPPSPRSDGHELVAGQWGGLIAKDVWQDALCSIWAEFVKAGLDATRVGGAGLTWDETEQLARSLVGGPPLLEPTMPTTELAHLIMSDGIGFAGALDGPLASASLESLRLATEALSSAASGLVVVLELKRRASGRNDPGWIATSRVRSAWQPSVAEVLTSLSAHLEEGPSIADTMWWIIHRYVIRVHERIAYSKLPEDTFRFRWEDGRVRFFENGIGRFPLAAIRNEPLALITQDLGLWNRTSDDPAQLTELGAAFVAEVFA